MKRVITYGTFDLFHEGHRRLLLRAKELGDQLIVGVTSDRYDASREKLNVHQDLVQRIENVKASGLADRVIIEEYEGQKSEDIIKYSIDTFAIGSDWKGKFDYLQELCEVVYLDRTKGVSSTQLRNESGGILRLGIMGCGRIAERFILESKYVSGVEVNGVYGRDPQRIEAFATKYELSFFELDLEKFFQRVDAVYVATPHLTHYDLVRAALVRGKHVLAEKPLTLSKSETSILYDLAKANNLVLLEAIKTAFAPGFAHLLRIARSGLIGKIKSVEATFTKLMEPPGREFDKQQAGGSMTELASYPLLAIVKLIGADPVDTSFISYFDPESSVDSFTVFTLRYPHALGIGKVGIGVKSEGNLIVSGTEGYIYAPAPWWKTEHFELRYENPTENRRFFNKFSGEGLRYELAEFVALTAREETQSHKLTPLESIAICSIIEHFLQNSRVERIR